MEFVQLLLEVVVLQVIIVLEVLVFKMRLHVLQIVLENVGEQVMDVEENVLGLVVELVAVIVLLDIV